MRIVATQQGWMDHMMGPGWGSGWLWMLVWLVVLVLVGIAAWKVIQMAARGGAGGAGGGGESALEILKRRYARGEIDREEFERKKRDLEGP